MNDYYGFEKLECWKQAKDLAVEICRMATGAGMNGDRTVGDLLSRSAVTMMTLIAEGKERRSAGDFIQYLRDAQSSTAALRSGLILSRDMGYLAEGDFLDYQDRAHRIAALIGGLINAVRKSRKSRPADVADNSRSGVGSPEAETPF